MSCFSGKKTKCSTSPSALKRCKVLLYWLLLWLKKGFNLIFPTTSWSFWSLIKHQFVHNCNVHQAAFEAWSLCASTDGLNPYLTATMASRTVGRSKGLAARCFNRLLREFIFFLVGGWTNPSEKYESNWECSPIFGVNIKKIFEFPPTFSLSMDVLWYEYMGWSCWGPYSNTTSDGRVASWRDRWRPNSIQLPQFQYIRNISESIVLILALTQSTVSICNKHINHHTYTQIFVSWHHMQPFPNNPCIIYLPTFGLNLW